MSTHTWDELTSLAQRQHGLITRRQCGRLGFDWSRLRTPIRHGWLEELIPGVLRVAGSPSSWAQQLMSATLVTLGVASHRSAARLHGLDGFVERIEVDVTIDHGVQRALDGVTIHRAVEGEQNDIITVGGIRATGVARTLCDLGAVVDDDAVERALDDAIRGGFSERWIRETLERAHRPGPSGTHSLRRVLALPDRSGSVPGSWRERVTERMLVHPELQPIKRQCEIWDAAGDLIARCDLGIPVLRLGIEYHSDQWHFGPRRGRSDRRRDLRASAVGWELIYLDAADHETPDDAVATVVEVARSRRGHLGTGGEAG
jgi:hypothetical protein